MELKGEIGKYTIKIRGFSIPFPILDRASRQKISEGLNHVIN